MEEYIVRDEVVRELERRERAGDEIFSIRAMKHYIKTRLSADVAPVQHGTWHRIDDDGIYKCSNCGELCYVEEIKGKPTWRYCPYCGAKMD